LTGRRRLPLLLRKAWFGLNQTFRRFSAKSGITPDQFTVLRTLIEHEPSQLTQSELAAKMTSDPNTITSLLKRMEASGLIQRRADTEDRRARRIILNAAGRQTYEHAAPMALELQARVLMSLPEDRRELFLQELEIIANSCQNALKRWQ
jgi:DNA-binding MarR family transcriptional regulator